MKRPREKTASGLSITLRALFYLVKIMAKRKTKRLYETKNTQESIVLWREAELKPAGDSADFTGREWQVTIIGPKSEADLVTVEGELFIRSANSRLYSVSALEASIPQWDGIKVYDNHLTDAEFEAKQGMRSVDAEWLGTIVKPFWDNAANAVKGFFKVVEDTLATKLKNAFDQGVLNTIGLSIDTFPIINREVQLEGNRFPVIEGFEKILSVDLVAEPAAGGSLDRIIAATVKEKPEMKLEEIKTMVTDTLADLVPDIVKATLAEAATAAESEAADADGDQDQETEDTEDTPKKGDEGDTDIMAQAEQAAADAVQEAKLVKSELELERKLNAAKLADSFRKPIEQAFVGKIFETNALEAMIKSLKEAQADADPSGRVTEGTVRKETITGGLDGQQKLEVEFMRLAMGNSPFRDLEHNKENFVKERTSESNAYGDWIKSGKPNSSSGSPPRKS